MTIEAIRDYCLGKPGAAESFPFGPDTLVFKVEGKVFALMSLDNQPLTLNLKCDPERAVLLRETHDAVQPGYHMNKRHWNTITMAGNLRTADLFDWITHSYELVVQGLPKAIRARLQANVS